MTNINRRTVLAGLGSTAIAGSARAQATDWPNRPVRVVVPLRPAPAPTSSCAPSRSGYPAKPASNSSLNTKAEPPARSALKRSRRA